MFQLRVHGRGGQGVVTAAEILSIAAFIDGLHAQAFPSFGAERMGAPVTAFCRIDDRPIRSHEPVSTPDALIIQDPTLLTGGAAVFADLAAGGFVLINTDHPIEIARLTGKAGIPAGHVRAIPASRIATRHLGRPLPNTPMLGGLVALCGVVRRDSLFEALRQKFPGDVGERNVAAAREAYEFINHREACAPAAVG